MGTCGQPGEGDVKAEFAEGAVESSVKLFSLHAASFVRHCAPTLVRRLTLEMEH